MKDEYIRRDDVVKECGEWYTEEGPEEGFIGTVSQMLDMFSPADVAPVVHGKWTKLSYDDFNCNKCGSTFVIMQGRNNMYYCPNCGAKMDGGK